jgi:hypothetical protein
MVTIELQVCSVSSSPLIFSAGLGTGKDERLFIVVISVSWKIHGLWYLNPRLIAVL